MGYDTSNIFITVFNQKFVYPNIVYIETEIFPYCDFKEAQRVEKVQVLLSYQDRHSSAQSLWRHNHGFGSKGVYWIIRTRAIAASKL